MDSMYSHDFDKIVNAASSLQRPARVALAGADVENILLGLFDAQEAGFAEPILIGNYQRIMDKLKALGLENRSFDLQPVADDVNVVQYAIDMVAAGKADVLMRGNTQTRDFLLPIVNKTNHLLEDGLMTHVSMIKIPDYHKVLFISDVTLLVKPNADQKEEIIKNMVRVMKVMDVKDPKIAILSLIETPNFYMKDTLDAANLVVKQKRHPFAECKLVGPIPWDLIVSKEAARLKNYDCEYCGEFDGIVMPDLMSGNLLIKVLQMNARANSCGIIAGAKVPIAITSRSDSKEQAFLSLAACAILAQTKKYEN